TEDGPVPVVRALLHDDVDDAAESTAVLGLDAGVLDFDLIDEVERNVGGGVAADQVGGFLAFHEVGILRVRTAGDRETVVAAVGGTAGSRTTGAVAGISAEAAVAHQGLVASGGSKLNDRLEAAPVRDGFDDVFGDVGGGD